MLKVDMNENDNQIVELYEITTPFYQFIAVQTYDVTAELAQIAEYTWSSVYDPTLNYPNGFYYLIPIAHKSFVESELKPHHLKYYRLYWPRFGEDEWRKVNSIQEAA